MENKEIPKGWRETKLGEVAEIGSATRIFAKDYEEKGVPFYRSKEIIEKAFGNDITESIFISTEKYKEIKNKYGVPVEGDLLLSSVGNRSGIPYVVRKEKFYFKDGNLTWFKNFLKDCNSIFIYYWLKSNIGQASLNSIMIGSAQKALTISALQKLKITIPSTYEEQVAIGQVLSSLDEKIELLQEENKTLETLAQTIFTEWFVNFNFPGATGEMEDSELGEIPKGWRVGKLGEELLTLESGSRPKGGIDQNLKEGIPSIGAENINGIGKYKTGSTKYITAEFFQNMKKGKVKNYDILIYKDGAYVGKKAMFGNGFPFAEFAVNEHVFILRTNELLHQFFIYFSLIQEKLAQLNTNSAQPGLNQSAINNYKIVIPTNDLMDNFGMTAKAIVDKMLFNSLQANNLKTTRDTLLPKLTTGEIRVESFGE